VTKTKRTVAIIAIVALSVALLLTYLLLWYRNWDL